MFGDLHPTVDLFCGTIERPLINRRGTPCVSEVGGRDMYIKDTTQQYRVMDGKEIAAGELPRGYAHVSVRTLNKIFRTTRTI